MSELALHGRDAQLRVLRDGLASARQGRGHLVLLSGEAGIGKSALANAIAAEASDAAVTWGRAWEFAEAPPYFPLWPCLRSLGIDATGSLDDGRAFELWEQVLSALAREAAARTIVWLVEDLHAADLGTLDLLTFLVQPLRALRVLIVATVRPHDARVGDRKLQRLARIARDGVEVRLEPLVERAIAAIAEDTLGQVLPEPALHRLVELTGGNPLFAIECARAVRAAGVERTLERLPPTVRQIVIERVAMLPEATRRVLDAGAVLGRELSAATVARMLDSQPSRVIDELLPALRAGVLRETRAGQFTFSHVIVRDAVEDAIPDDARVRLHARADAALAELGDSAEILVERARHALAAARAGDPARALAIVQRAAELLPREGAFDRAFELHERVGEARAAGYLPPAAGVELLHAARTAREAGRSDVMRQLCDEVAAAARGSDPELFARAVLLHATGVRVAVIDAHQVALLEEARAMLPPGPTACRVAARLATALQPADDYTRPHALARSALGAARALDDDALILDVLNLAMFGTFGAPRAERHAWLAELHERALRADDIPKALAASSLLAMMHLEVGDFAAFGEGCTSTLALSEGTHPRHRWDPLLLASGHAVSLGRFAESDRYVTEVAQIAALIDDPALALSQVLHDIMRARYRRRPDEIAAALGKLDDVLRDVKRAPLYGAAVRAACAASLDDLDGTRAALAMIGTQVRLLETDVEAIGMLVEPLVLVGSAAEQRWAREVLLAGRATFPEIFAYGISYIYDGTVDRYVGLLDAALGDLASAEDRLRGAYELVKRRGQAPWIATLAHELAGVVTRRGRDPRALVDEASAIASELGMLGFGPAAPAQAAQVLQMTRAADVWTVQRGDVIARIKDSRGVQLLARLVERPTEEIHVLALASDEGASAPESSAGDMLDERARKAYRKRIAEIDDALERTTDETTMRRLEREKAAIVRELARAAGIGGRTRQAGSATERARVNTQRRLKEAIARVAEANGELGAYLDRAVRTGTFCCFRP